MQVNCERRRPISVAIQRQWQHLTWGWFLLPLSAVYRLGIMLYRNLKVRVYHPLDDVPFWVIGNRSVGGNGKTPFLLWVLARSRRRNLKIVVISKGYGRKKTREAFVIACGHRPELAGDEPSLIARCAPGTVVLVGSNRRQLYHLACTVYRPDLILFDDGFHDPMLRKGYHFVLQDPARQGNGYCLPMGPMREPESALKRANTLIAANDPTASHTNHITHQIDRAYRLGDPNQLVALSHFKGQQVRAYAAIANPERFFDQLRAFGMAVIACVHEDHRAFDYADFQGHGNQAILMTEKDAIKCQDIPLDNVWVVPLSLCVSDTLTQTVDQLIDCIST